MNIIRDNDGRVLLGVIEYPLVCNVMSEKVRHSDPPIWDIFSWQNLPTCLMLITY